MSAALVVRAGALGDLLLLRPLVAALRTRHSRIDLLAPAVPGRALVGTGPGDVDRLLDWDAPEHAPLLRAEPLPAPLADRLGGYGEAVLVSRNETLVAHVRGRVPRATAVDPRPPGGVHAAGHFVAATGAALEVPPASLPDAGEERRAAELTRGLAPGFLTVHPGSGSAAKNWPADRFVTLVERLIRDEPFLLVEGPADAEACAPLVHLRGAARVRDAPLRALGAALSLAGLYVGNDSGVSHLAAAWGAPTLALFGPTDPDTWSPLGPIVGTLRAPDGDLGLLDVADVERAAGRLGRSAPPPGVGAG